MAFVSVFQECWSDEPMHQCFFSAAIKPANVPCWPNTLADVYQIFFKIKNFNIRKQMNKQQQNHVDIIQFYLFRWFNLPEQVKISGFCSNSCVWKLSRSHNSLLAYYLHLWETQCFDMPVCSPVKSWYNFWVKHDTKLKSGRAPLPL